MTISGLGPHGERAVPADQIKLTEIDGEQARAKRFSVAVVLHTTTSDWSKQELAGIVATLGEYSAAVVEVVDCNFDSGTQIQALERLQHSSVDAIISIPVGNATVAEAYRALVHNGKKLVMLDNVPTGLLPGTDYASVVSTDNFGLGEISARLLAQHIPLNGTAGILGYGVDFFATQQREIAFRRWLGVNRTDITIIRNKFADVTQAATVTEDMIDRHPELSGLFAVWDVPAQGAVSALRSRSKHIPITTVDLGYEAALELAQGDFMKGVAGQRPYDQGTAASRAILLALLGNTLPPWIALPGIEVRRDNVVEAYQVIWHAPAPAPILKARGMSDDNNDHS